LTCISRHKFIDPIKHVVIVIPWGVKLHIIHSLYLALTCYKRSPFFLSCHRQFHMNWTSFKRSPVLKEHFFSLSQWWAKTSNFKEISLLIGCYNFLWQFNFFMYTIRIKSYFNLLTCHAVGDLKKPHLWPTIGFLQTALTVTSVKESNWDTVKQVEIWFYSDCIHKKVKLSSKMIATY
jgi:hypothetical protein